MGYLSEYEHDIFVSYAHSELLNDWSKRLVDDARKLVAAGLGMKQAKDVDLWMDYKISGNAPLTRQLRGKVEKSGVLLVLMSQWYLDSSWCRHEVEWFFDAIRQKRADRPVFVVRVRSTDHTLWPDVFKDEHGHPVVGYDFVGDAEDSNLGLPKGYPSPEHAPDSKKYYEAVSKLASDIVGEMKALALGEAPQPARTPGPCEEPRSRERVFLAAAPEDVEDLRDELAGWLRANGCVVVPEDHPLDVEQVHEQAREWISSCDKFVQVLGSFSGSWRHDDAGFVIHQHELAKQNNKPIFVYRAPSLETSQVKKRQYREFLELLDQDDVGDLQSFAERVVRFAASSFRGADACQSVFMMASERDQILEGEIRRLLGDLNIEVFPLPRSGSSGREVASVLDDGSFLNIVRRCGAILLINGSVKEEDRLWVDDRVADIKFDIQRKLGGQLPYAIVDGPPDPRLEPREGVFPGDSPTFKHDLQGWLRTLGPPAGQVGGLA